MCVVNVYPNGMLGVVLGASVISKNRADWLEKEGKVEEREEEQKFYKKLVSTYLDRSFFENIFSQLSDDYTYVESHFMSDENEFAREISVLCDLNPGVFNKNRPGLEATALRLVESDIDKRKEKSKSLLSFIDEDSRVAVFRKGNEIIRKEFGAPAI